MAKLQLGQLATQRVASAEVQQFGQRMAGQVAGHELAVTLFTTAAKESHDAEVNAVAAETLPALQEHLDRARQLTQR